jgi:hypothetical protein
METISNINELALDKVSLRDRPYLLYIENPIPTVISQLAFRYTADRISYRDNLIERHTSISKSQSLNLQFHHARELEAIKEVCRKAIKPIVILEDLDVMLAYLATRSRNYLDSFWHDLATTRQFACPIWILLPTSWKIEMSAQQKLWDDRVRFL